MAKAKEITNAPDKKPEVTDAAKNGKGSVVATAPAPAKAPGVRRGPGAKEVIPFEWKVVGEARGLTLTLFKAIEREEVEAHLARLTNDGYYKKLRILDNSTRVKQTATALRVPIRPGDKPKKTNSKSQKAKTPKAEATHPPATRPKTDKTAKPHATRPKTDKTTKVADAKRAKPKSPPKKPRAAKSTKGKSAKTTKTARPAKASKTTRAKPTTKPAKKKTAAAKSTRKRTAKKKK